MVKAVNVLTILSFLFFLATLLFVYAYLPVMVNVYPDTYGWTIHKEYFFYGLLAGFVVLNVFLFVLNRLIQPLISSEELQAWLKGLAFVLNFYFSFLIGYVGVVNNAQHFGQGSYGYLNYLGPLLIIAWVIGIFFFITKRNKTA